MKFVKAFLIGIVVFSSGLILLPQQTFGATKDDICAGVALTGGSCTGSGTGPTVESTIAVVINVLSLIVGVIAVIMIIIAGLRYITSGGDSNSTKGAKDTILYAIIGLVVVAMAQVIVRFVLSKV